MIVYSATREEFRHDVQRNIIDNKILEKFREVTGGGTGEAEIRSWRNSLPVMDNVLRAPPKTPFSDPILSDST